MTDKSHGIKRARKIAALARRVGWLGIIRKKDQASAELVSSLYKMGGVYLKFLQIIANLMPDFPGMTEEIRKDIFNAVPSQDINLHRVLTKEIGPDYMKNFVYISSHVFATGSFAVVYEGMHNDGKKVIIKVLRPQLLKQLKTDMKFMSLLSRGAQPIIRSDLVNLVEVYKNYKATVIKETDYKGEVKNAELMRAQLAGHKNIVVPKTYVEICSKNVIVQEKLEGLPLSDLIAGKLGDTAPQDFINSQLGSDLVLQMQKLGFSLLASSIDGPYTHGDPHPGNIILMKNNKVGLIDFGVLLPGYKSPNAINGIWELDYRASKDLTIDVAENIVRMFRLYNTKIFEAIDRVSEEMSTLNKDVDLLGDLKNLCAGLIKPHLESIENNYKKGLGVQARVILDLINIDNRFAIKADKDTARLARTQSQFWSTMNELGIIKQVSSGVHESLRTYIKENAQTILSREEKLGLGESIEIVSEWFGKMYERDPLLFGQLFAKIRKTLQSYESELTQNA